MTPRSHRSTRSLEQWLVELQAEAGVSRLGRGGSRLLLLIAREPEFTSYASVGEVAARTGIHPSTVTRIAQALGFGGWPAFRAAARTIYLDDPRLRQAHRPHSAVAVTAVSRELRNLEALDDPSIQNTIKAIAAAVRTSRRTVIIGSGLAAAPGTVISHLCTVAGLDVRLNIGAATSQIAVAAGLRADDCLIGINVWRMTRAFYEVMRIAHGRAASTCLITDSPGSRLSPVVDHLLWIGTSSDSALPSAVAMTAAAHLITREAIGAEALAHAHEVERLWDSAALMDEHD